MVSIGGTTLGLLWGLATAFVTKFTDHVRGKLLHCTISLVEDLTCRYAEGSSGQFFLAIHAWLPSLWTGVKLGVTLL